MRNGTLLPWLRGTLLVGGGIIVFVAAIILGSSGNTASTRAPVPPPPQYPPWESEKAFAFPANWETVRVTTVRTIYPGQSSWEGVTSPEHLGSESVLAGTSCASCHGSPIVGAPSPAGWAGPPANHKQGLGCQSCHGVLEQRVERLGEKLVSDPLLEKDPIAGKRPYLDVQVKAAFDEEYLYLQLRWDSPRPGILHDLLRWDGKGWAIAGGPKPEAEREGRRASFEDKLGIAVAGDDIPAFDGAKVGYSAGGCWLTCHSEIATMPRSPRPSASTCAACHDVPKEGIPPAEDHPADLNVNKYLLITRTRGGDPKPPEELQRLLRGRYFLDMWVWHGALSAPVGYGDDLYVLESRLRDRGAGPWGTQRGDTVYDEGKTGFRAIPENKLEEYLGRAPLVYGVNSAPVTPGAQFTVGDVLPRRLLRPPTSSAADIQANSRWEKGQWTLELRRKLDTGNQDDQALQPGRAYVIGIAVFEDNVGGRRHHVSFPVTLGLNTAADILAAPVQGPR